MLTATVSYKGQPMLYSLLSSHGLTYNNNMYTLELSNKAGGQLKVINSLENNTIELQFPQEVAMEDCQNIYNIISHIADHTEGSVHDSNAHIGYDEAGNKVFIYHGFSVWTDFIDKAKHKSLEGQKVAVYYGDDIIGEGILLTYKRKQVSSNKKEDVLSCTLVTTEGEQTFHGENMEIVPMTEW
ncbi:MULTISPECIES: hypothetical protein [Bacillaceae]|uniref:Uncharacterized protein n=1 Tax=Evansella alkalicola TaxID=745819 RepID=A0ABS6JTA0_9BACI|nr:MULTISPECIES: hypothetical protein [Bacillaceae]MBU9721808.1 hypothetical protein [Bacillus alkalicola]